MKINRVKFFYHTDEKGFKHPDIKQTTKEGLQNQINTAKRMGWKFEKAKWYDKAYFKWYWKTYYNYFSIKFKRHRFDIFMGIFIAFLTILLGIIFKKYLR